MSERRAFTPPKWKPRNEQERQKALKSLEFFTHLLTFTKGKWAKRPFVPLDWQREQMIFPLFGALRPDGRRRYTSAWFEVGKKSGKSEIAAGIGLKGLFADDFRYDERRGRWVVAPEPMAEVYIGAVDRDQAGQIFTAAARMVKQNPRLRKRCDVLTATKRIVVTSGPSEGSILEALASDADSADGKSPSCLIFDEVHRYTQRDFYDTLIESTSAREQPLVVRITTAGTDTQSLAWTEHEYARQVIEGTIEDPSLLALIYAAKPDADFRDWRSWAAALPSIGETVSWDWLENRARKADEDPTSENSFRRFYLNHWTSQEERWMPMDRWDASAGPLEPERILEEIRKVPSWGGLDLSQTRDLSALLLVGAPAHAGGPFRTLMRCWIPDDNVDRASRRDGVRYDRWVADGWIMTTPGDTIDYGTIERQVRADSLRFPGMQAIAFDPTYAWQMAQQLTAAGIVMVPIRQGFETMAGPTADLLQLVKERRFEHGGNPVLRWMADNVVVEQDSIGRWRPSKRKAKKRIDGIVAAIMGLDLAERALFGAPADDGDEVMVYSDEVQISPRI